MKSPHFIFAGLLGCLCFITLVSCGSDDDNNTPPNSFTDARDGNVYQTVTIGEQVWMAENLKYLPGVVGPEAGSTVTPYYYVYNYNGLIVSEAKALNNYDTYGVLYNWPAAMNGEMSSELIPSGVQGICPDGWHLPSPAEWTELLLFVGDGGEAGGKLKETGTNHWLLPNTGATNEFGFTALPGGARGINEVFSTLGEVGWWWSTRGGGETSANFYRLFHNNDAIIGFSQSKSLGLSVRCVKD
ncbi:FISUMP domain-containing protein [Paucihalobacter sp.]|uniref:FISUMP domain-containing protein n=1 Tax=Paucihalobacter sp. TaxID=2850405 RepID=UPI003D160A7B